MKRLVSSGISLLANVCPNVPARPKLHDFTLTDGAKSIGRLGLHRTVIKCL